MRQTSNDEAAPKSAWGDVVGPHAAADTRPRCRVTACGGPAVGAGVPRPLAARDGDVRAPYLFTGAVFHQNGAGRGFASGQIVVRVSAS